MFNNHYYIILTNDQVVAAKEEFFRIFEAALNGMIETRFMRDTAEVLTSPPPPSYVCYLHCHHHRWELIIVLVLNGMMVAVLKS